MNFLDSADDPKRAARRPLLFFVLVTLAVGAAASVFSEPNIPIWYASLNRPFFAPPGWLLAWLWTGLYLLMAIAAWRAWKVTGFKSTAMALYALQLAFTFVWTALFFGRHQIGLAFAALGLLALLRLAANILFWRANRMAGLLFLPCLGWGWFEVVLVYAFLDLNR